MVGVPVPVAAGVYGAVDVLLHHDHVAQVDLTVAAPAPLPHVLTACPGTTGDKHDGTAHAHRHAPLLLGFTLLR